MPSPVTSAVLFGAREEGDKMFSRIPSYEGCHPNQRQPGGERHPGSLGMHHRCKRTSLADESVRENTSFGILLQNNRHVISEGRNMSQ